jgi:sulfide:quinone oxidoreductase
MIDSHLRARGIRDAARLTVVIPEPKPLGVAGPEASNRVASILADRDIALDVAKRVTAVEGRIMRFDDDSGVEADVPITVPVHRVPKVVATSGLTDGKPFVAVDHDSIETAHPNVFAVGDVNSIPLGENRGIPKAGVFAAGQGRHVAAVIASRLGAAPDPGGYDGIGHCFLMLGSDLGAQIGGDFYGDAVGLDVPSAEGRRAKDLWEREWARFEV